MRRVGVGIALFFVFLRNVELENIDFRQHNTTHGSTLGRLSSVRQKLALEIRRILGEHTNTYEITQRIFIKSEVRIFNLFSGVWKFHGFVA